jgi:glycosyltransferase involved in cell wall biosynthesis
MTTILVDLLHVTLGGGITRARNFIRRFSDFADHASLIVLKDVSLELDDARGTRTISVPIGRGRAAKRMLWQSLNIPGFMRAHRSTVYLTFGHFLPWTLPSATRSVVCVSNMAPFSPEAAAAESSIGARLRLVLLRRSIVNSARRATYVIALSDTCRRALVKAGVDAAKIHVIPNGVELLPAMRSPDDSGELDLLGIRGEYLLYVSHFYPYKNFECVLQAYAKVSPALRARYQLVLVGTPYVMPYYLQVRRAVVDLRLGDRVIVVPGLAFSKLHPVYARAAAFVFPSLVENSPNTLLEAMSHGVPVIVGRREPMPEFAGDAAEYFDPLSAEDCARVLANVLENEQLRGAMSGKSRERARRYSWDDFTANVVRLCEMARNGVPTAER